jgi:hypothetical protein
VTHFRDILAPYVRRVCPICNKPIEGKPGGRPKEFCSAACRKTAQRRRDAIQPGLWVESIHGVGRVRWRTGNSCHVLFREGNVLRDIPAEELRPYRPKAPKKATFQIMAPGDVATIDGCTPAQAPLYRHGRTWKRNYYPSATQRLARLMEDACGNLEMNKSKK